MLSANERTVSPIPFNDEMEVLPVPGVRRRVDAALSFSLIRSATVPVLRNPDEVSEGPFEEEFLARSFSDARRGEEGRTGVRFFALVAGFDGVDFCGVGSACEEKCGAKRAL